MLRGWTTAQLGRALRRIALVSLAMLAMGVTPAVNGQSQAIVRKVIIDTDPGTDDALAILLALNSPELDVRAITIVAGNVTVNLGLENALKVMSLAGRAIYL